MSPTPPGANTRPTPAEGLRAIHGLVPQSLEEAVEIGRVLSRSGFFRDSLQEAQAVAKILAGLELAFPPVVSLTGIHLVEGKVTLSANLMAAKVRSHPRYDFRVEWLPETHNARGCAITFLRDGEPVGVSVFTEEDARRAGLLHRPLWQSYLRNMCYARAMANGCRWYAPDAFNGQPVYTPEELGLTIDGETGEPAENEAVRGDTPTSPPGVVRAWSGPHKSADLPPIPPTPERDAGPDATSWPRANSETWEVPEPRPATVAEIRKSVLQFCNELGVVRDRFAYLNYFNSVLKSEDERPWMKFEEIGADDWGAIWDELEAGVRKRRQCYALLRELGIDPDANGGADRRAYLSEIVGCELATTQGLTPGAWERCAYVMLGRLQYPELAAGATGVPVRE